MPKSLRELRAARSKLNKHVVVIRLTDAEEEKLVKKLEEARLTLATYINELLRSDLGSHSK